MSKPPTKPSLNIGSNLNNGGGGSGGGSSDVDSNSSTASSTSSRRKHLNLHIVGGSSLPASTRPRSPAPFSLPFPTQDEQTKEFNNTHAETDAKFNEIMNNDGRLTIDGKSYKTAVTDLEHLGELGNGTCGHVVRMKHIPSGKIIAVKQMRKSGNRDENKRIIMDLEVVLKSHDCPYIVQCLGCFITDSDVWICMELMATCMDKLLKKLKEPLPEYIIGKVAVATLNALHYLKECHGVIHRDVKPSNILLDNRGNVKLCDFGISGRLVDSKAKTRSAGCTAYMAPERIDPPDPSRPNYDIRADVWSLGITLVELATGKFPYGDCTTEFEVMTRILEHDPPSLPSGKYSPEFHTFVKLCLIKNYRHRPKYKALLEEQFIKISEAKTFDICTWYNVVCGSTTPTTGLGGRRQLQSPSAASLNHFYLPGTGSSSVGRHTGRLRSSPSPSSASAAMLPFANNNASNHQHRLGSAGSSTSSSSGYYSSIISPRTPIRTTPSPISSRSSSRYEEFVLPCNGKASNNLYYPQQQQQAPQYNHHRTTFDRLNSEPLPNVRSPQTPHSPIPGNVIIPPDPPPRANRHGSSSDSHSNSTTSTPVSVTNNTAFLHASLSTNNIGNRSRSSSPMSPSPNNDMLLSRVNPSSSSNAAAGGAVVASSSNYSSSSNPTNSPNNSPANNMSTNSPPNGIPAPSSQSLRRIQRILLCYPGC